MTTVYCGLAASGHDWSVIALDYRYDNVVMTTVIDLKSEEVADRLKGLIVDSKDVAYIDIQGIAIAVQDMLQIKYKNYFNIAKISPTVIEVRRAL